MANYRHVLLAADLIPVDDDPVSAKALEIAQQNKATLSLVHIIENPVSYGPASIVPTFLDWQKEAVEKAQENFNTLAEELEIPSDHRHLILGKPKAKILEIAQEIDADLIVMGRHRREGLEYLFLGSTANAVIQHAKCDVLAIQVSTT